MCAWANTQSHLKLFGGTIANRPTQYSIQSGLSRLSGLSGCLCKVCT